MIGYYNYTVVLTYVGLVSAIFGICSAMNGRVSMAVICLLFSGFCDMFDGQIARTRERTDEEKRFGVQIDSLADLICFGVLPSVIGYAVGLDRLWDYMILALFVLAALIRLAYFNVTEEKRQKETTEKRRSYEGLPVTNAALIFPIVYLFRRYIGADIFPYVYGGALIVTGCAFLFRFKVRKAGIKGLLIVAAVGALVLLWILKSSMADDAGSTERTGGKEATMGVLTDDCEGQMWA